MPRKVAFTAVVIPEGFIIGIAEEGVPGFTHDKREPMFPDWDAAHRRAEELNRSVLGLTDQEAYRIVGSSMNTSLKEPGGKWKQRG